MQTLENKGGGGWWGAERESKSLIHENFNNNFYLFNLVKKQQQWKLAWKKFKF